MCRKSVEEANPTALATHSKNWPREPRFDQRPSAAVIFYRALVASADTMPIAALCEALDGKGLNPVAVYVTSLKDDRSATFLVLQGIGEYDYVPLAS